MSYLHGFRKGNEIIHITQLKGYKKPVLMIGNGYSAWKVGSFDSEGSAEQFIQLLEGWLCTDANCVSKEVIKTVADAEGKSASGAKPTTEDFVTIDDSIDEGLPFE